MMARQTVTHAKRRWYARCVVMAVAVCGALWGCGDDGSADPTPDLRAADTTVVREILDVNGLRLVPVDSVAEIFDGRVYSLNLSYRGLYRIPGAVGTLGGLRELYLHGNRLSSLPDSITLLTQLTTLTLGRNRLCDLAPAVQVWADEYVTIAGWQSTQECVGLADDTGAVRAILDVNGLRTLPVMDVCDTFDDRVVGLQLEHRGLTVIPDTIAELGKLQRLQLSDNVLQSLPTRITALSSLVELSIYDNRLCALDTVVALWADGLNPRWREFQRCGIVEDTLNARLFPPELDSVDERSHDWVFVETVGDSLCIDSIRVTGRGAAPLRVTFRPIGASSYSAALACTLRTSGPGYAQAGGSPRITLGRDAPMVLTDFEVQPCIECAGMQNAPAARVGDTLSVVLVFKYRRIYRDTVVSGMDTLVSGGQTDGTRIGALRALRSGLKTVVPAGSTVDQLDFDSLADTCLTFVTVPAHSLYDIRIGGDSISAFVGVRALDTMVVPLTLRNCPRLDSLRQSLASLDFAVEQGGWRSSIHLVQGGVYWIRARDGGHAILINCARQPGGYDLYEFLWARYAE